MNIYLVVTTNSNTLFLFSEVKQGEFAYNKERKQLMVRGWVEEMGYRKEEYFTKVRPYKVDGVPQLRAEVKRKDATGSHFRRVSSWTCPPLDRKLW